MYASLELEYKISKIIIYIVENFIKFENIPEKDFYSDIIKFIMEYNEDTNYKNKEAITKLINTSDENL